MRWVAAAAIAVVAVGIALVGVLLPREPSLDELMNRRVVAALERAQPTEAGEPSAHGGHDAEPVNANRRTDIDGHELRCVAKVFGHDPPGATSINDVKTIYAHRMCAAVDPGLTWPSSIRESGPVAVHLGIPDELLMPEKDNTAAENGAVVAYPDRVRAIIPERYHQQALAHADFVDPDVREELQERMED
jgi:hypothetical protein